MRTCRLRHARHVIWVTLAVSAAWPTAHAFVLFNSTWPNGDVSISQRLGGSGSAFSDGSASFDSLSVAAFAAWNRQLSAVLRTGVATPVQFRPVVSSSTPEGNRDGVNSVFFSTNVFGSTFEGGVLAVTTNWSTNGVRTEADVIYNASLKWDSYRGALRQNAPEFFRVALHEYGHVLGLDHPDEFGQSVTAIMNSTISDVDQLMPDDIAGAQALYKLPWPSTGSVSFPPLSEAIDFRNQLEQKYRVGLGRSPSTSYLTNEDNVRWTGEYLRYRVNICSQQQATFNVLAMINGEPPPVVCGVASGPARLPTLSDSVDFRDQLEAKFRDSRPESLSLTAVDREDDVRWTREYFRYRLNRCGQAIAINNVFVQIDGGAAPSICP